MREKDLFLIRENIILENRIINISSLTYLNQLTATEVYDRLRQRRVEIEKKYGLSFEWDFSDRAKKEKRIVYRTHINNHRTENWNTIFDWMIYALEPVLRMVKES